MTLNMNYMHYQHQALQQALLQRHLSLRYHTLAGEQAQYSMQTPVVNPLKEDVTIDLENKDLWHKFHKETTEMIITKTGRRMFPAVQVSVKGLERRARYTVLMEMLPSSSRRHKYVCGSGETQSRRGWMTAGPAEPQPVTERRIYIHPDSPATGTHWMQNSISFSKLKLTNNITKPHQNVLLTSMHKYIPRIWIIRCEQINSVKDLYTTPGKCIVFKETEFIAVTAYQNENITKLKIDHNPFAKGFRESGQSSCKRKRQRLGCTMQEEENNNDDFEEETASFYDSEADNPLEKRIKMEIDETCSVSSNPSPPLEPKPEVRPRLYRPWADSEEEEEEILVKEEQQLIEPKREVQVFVEQTLQPQSIYYSPEFVPTNYNANYQLAVHLHNSMMRENQLRHYMCNL